MRQIAVCGPVALVGRGRSARAGTWSMRGGRPSRPWAHRSIQTCRSHTPDGAQSDHWRGGRDCCLADAPNAHYRLAGRRSTPKWHCIRPGDDWRHPSAPPPRRNRSAYRPAAPADRQDPAAHTHRPPSAPPAPPPPSRHCAARRSPPDRPGPRPTRAGNAPTGWNLCSIRHTSATPHPAPPRWPRDHARPAPRTTRAHTHRADNPSPLHSTPSIPVGALPRPATADDPPPYLRRPRPPSPPTDTANAPSTAPASHARTTLWHRSECRRSLLRFRPTTTTGRTARLFAQRPAHWHRVRQDPIYPAACSAMRTSLGTAAHASGCVAAAPVPPPVRTECPDAPAPVAHAPSPMPATAPASASQTPPPATPAY